MRTYRNLIDGKEVVNTTRSAECIQDIMRDAIMDFPVDGLIQERIYFDGENDEHGYTAIVAGIVYEITTR
jgi:hypothetical protein